MSNVSRKSGLDSITGRKPSVKPADLSFFLQKHKNQPRDNTKKEKKIQRKNRKKRNWHWNFGKFYSRKYCSFSFLEISGFFVDFFDKSETFNFRKIEHSISGKGMYDSYDSYGHCELLRLFRDYYVIMLFPIFSIILLLLQYYISLC